MRLRYKEVACRTLTLILWLAVGYSLYFTRNAKVETPTAANLPAEAADLQDETADLPVKTEDDALPQSDDCKTKGTTQKKTLIITRGTSSRSERRSSMRPKTQPSSLRPSLLSTALTPTREFIPTSSSLLKPTSVRPINRKPVAVKPVAVKRNLSASAKSTPVTGKTTNYTMDEYSDMGGIVVKRSNTSTVVNPHPFNYTLNAEMTCDVGNSSSELFLLVYVHTRPESIKQRELIRSTWGDVKNYAVTVRRIFVMGLPKVEYVQEAVKLESNLYDDIVQEDFLDTYRNLTYKAIGALRWVKDFCSHAKFVLKTDDDTFVSMHLLLELLVSKRKTGAYGPRSLICNTCYHHSVLRSGKWAVTLAQRRHPKWPNFCQGLAYIMTPSVAADLYNVSFQVPFLWMDDVYITGFLAKKIGIEHTQIAQHYFREEEIEKQLTNPKLWWKVLFSHIHNFDRSRWAWNTVVKLQRKH